MLIEGLKSYSIVQKILKRGVHHFSKSHVLGLNLFPVSLEIVRGFLSLYKPVTLFNKKMPCEKQQWRCIRLVWSYSAKIRAVPELFDQ